MKNLLSIILIGFSSILYSQETIKIPDISKELVSYIDSLEQENAIKEKVTSLELSKLWASLTEVDQSNYEKMLEHQVKDAKSHHGLRMKFYANRNFKDATDDDEDLSYSSRYYAGLEWELLKNGFFKSFEKRDKVKFENEIKSILSKRKILKRNAYFGDLKIEKIFNTKIKEILSRKILVEKKIHYLYRLLSFEKHITKETVLEHLDMMYTTENILRNIDSDESSKFAHKSFPYLELDENAINEHKGKNMLDSLLLENQIKSIKTSSYILDNWSLRPNIKYNYYNRASGRDITFTSVGVLLSIPISSGCNKRKAMKYELATLNDNTFNVNKAKDERLNSLINDGKRYQRILMNKVIDKNIQELRMNTVRNRMHISPSTQSGLEYLEILSNNLSTEIAIIETNKQIYKNLLDISVSLDGVDPTLISKEISVDHKFQRIQDERYVYIWSQFVKNTSMKQVCSFLKEADIQNALISFNDLENKVEYINYLNKNNINVELLIGNNSILKKDPKHIREYIKGKLVYDIKGIHLDIEPHALYDWDQNKDTYYTKLIEIYTIAKEECDKKNIKLGVSIPVFYKEEFLRQIKPLCDKVFVMAYGTSDPNKILRRIKEELEIIGPKSLVIAFNDIDFSRAIERELVIDALKKRTGCTSIGYHKASTIFNINHSK